jgi:hypothetical protein
MMRNKYQNPARLRSLAFISMVRSGIPATEALRLAHTTMRTVRRHVGSALSRDPRTRRIVAKPGDTFRRDVNVLSAEGYVPATLRSSKQATLTSQHLIAVNRFIRTGNMAWLKPFLGKRVGGVELLTDPDRLLELANADLVKLDALYRDQRGGSEKSL